jgi:hypothetical protein
VKDIKNGKNEISEGKKFKEMKKEEVIKNESVKI